jgi:HlyD family secretion protein
MKLKKKTVLIAVVIVVAAAALGLTLLGGKKGEKTTYRKEAVSKGDIEAVVTTTGTVNPIEIVDVGSQVSGKVEKLYVDFNSQVTSGQVVAELDQEPLRMKVSQNEANYKNALASLERSKLSLETSLKKYERAKSLFEKNLISYEELETAEANYLQAKSDVVSREAQLAQAKSSLDLSKVDLAYAVIRSPVDGIIIKRNVSVGQTVQASFQAPVLFQVATDLTKMKVECSVDEADIGKVKEGQNVRFTVEAFPEDTFKGVVQQVRYSPETVQNVVTYTTVVNVDNPEKKLRPGMTATVYIIVGEAKNVLRVPNAALRFTPNLSQEEIDKLLAEMRDQMLARRQQEGGAQQPQAKAAPEGAAAGRAPGQFAQALGQGGQRSGQTGQRRQPSRVWLQDKDGKLRMAFIRPGVTDGTYTEVLGGTLKEGDEVIVGISTGTTTASSSAQQQAPRPGGPMMMFR